MRGQCSPSAPFAGRRLRTRVRPTAECPSSSRTPDREPRPAWSVPALHSCSALHPHPFARPVARDGTLQGLTALPRHLRIARGARLWLLLQIFVAHLDQTVGAADGAELRLARIESPIDLLGRLHNVAD